MQSHRLLTCDASAGALLCVVVSACGEKIDAVQEGTCSASVGAVTDQADLKQVFDTHCTSCHASTLAGAARNNAPSTIDFDPFALAAANAESASGAIQNDLMPPASAKVPAAAKAALVCWIEQGKPER